MNLAAGSAVRRRTWADGSVWLLWLNRAAARGTCATEGSIDDCVGAANTGNYTQRLESAIPLTRPTFDAGVTVNNAHLAIVSSKDRTGAYVQAYAAAATLFSLHS